MPDTPAHASAVVDNAQGPMENRRRGRAVSTVLDYAPSPLADPAVRRLRGLLVLLGCMIGGAVIGWAVDPREFQATGYVHVATETSATMFQPLSLSAVDQRQAAVAAAMTAPANLNAVVATLPLSLPPGATLTADDLTERLNVRPMPNSFLVAVTYTDRDPGTAAAVVNAVMRGGLARGMNIAAAATPPARPQRNRFFPTAGLAVGLLVGMLIVARHSK
jgi:capsular polysaccharide biosynthesis protein